MCIRDSTWLNPHVYLDTVFLLGTVANAQGEGRWIFAVGAPVSYTHLRAHETVLDLVCRLLLEKKKKNKSYANV